MAPKSRVRSLASIYEHEASEAIDEAITSDQPNEAVDKEVASSGKK